MTKYRKILSDNIPAELKALDQGVLWKYQARENNSQPPLSLPLAPKQAFGPVRQTLINGWYPGKR